MDIAIPKVYDPSFEIEGAPDYKFMGDLWKAKPGGQTEIVWQHKVPIGWDPFPIWNPTLIDNPAPQPY